MERVARFELVYASLEDWSVTVNTLPAIFGTPNRIRTGVASVKGMCPRPLDDGSLNLVPPVWIEQTTYRLQGDCSAAELQGLKLFGALGETRTLMTRVGGF